MPSVFVTVITSGMATLYRLSFDVCIESPRRFTSVYLASTVAVSPFFSFSPAPLRTICMYTPDDLKSTYSFSCRLVVESWASNCASDMVLIGATYIRVSSESRALIKVPLLMKERITLRSRSRRSP